MQPVTKDQFREFYFRLGGGVATGWTAAWWEQFLEPSDARETNYRIEEPATPAHTRMMIVSDTIPKEHRMFFLTEEEDGRMLEFPGTDD